MAKKEANLGISLYDMNKQMMEKEATLSTD